MTVLKQIKNIDINIKGKIIEQVQKYLDWDQVITEDCETEIRSRIAVVKNVFNEIEIFLVSINIK